MGASGPRDITGIVAGLGPGSFTGLRIGLATAKVLAYSLSVPIAGIATPLALALAATGDASPATHQPLTILLPAGASDRYAADVTWDGGWPVLAADPRLVPAGGPDPARNVVAVDIGPDEAGPEATARGAAAVDGLAVAMLALGARALREGRADDAATLVPAYVALPRGIARAGQEMVWSPDPR